jgi:nitroreductase
MVHELIEKRRSPRAFSDESISKETVETLFEAARLSASAGNGQPWRYIYATRENTETGNTETYDKLFGCLVEGNAIWAKKASLLILSLAKMTDANGDPREISLYDVGLANAQLALQATAMGLYVHQMGGFHRDKAIEAFGIPEGYRPVVMICAGYLGDVDALPEQLRAREIAPRSRKALSEIISESNFNFE